MRNPFVAMAMASVAMRNDLAGRFAKRALRLATPSDFRDASHRTVAQDKRDARRVRNIEKRKGDRR